MLRLPAAKGDGHITVPRSEGHRAQCLCGADSGGAGSRAAGLAELRAEYVRLDDGDLGDSEVCRLFMAFSTVRSAETLRAEATRS